MAADPSRSAWPAVPGPVDRESFFAAQRRNRRSAWRLSALSALIVVLMGMPLAAVISPLLYGLAFIAADLLNKLVPTPDIAHSGMAAASRVMDAIGSPKPMPVGTAVTGAVYLLAPGAILLLLLWLALRARFLGSGVGGVLLSFGAREPRPGDLEESQLVHVVEEMAIAAGVKPPRVRLLDSAVGANAAVVGSSIDDAVVVVSRRLLDELDRDETQAVVGHLVGAAANGDLRAALSLVSVYQALGLAATLLSAPYQPRLAARAAPLRPRPLAARAGRRGGGDRPAHPPAAQRRRRERPRPAAAGKVHHLPAQRPGDPLHDRLDELLHDPGDRHHARDRAAGGARLAQPPLPRRRHRRPAHPRPRGPRPCPGPPGARGHRRPRRRLGLAPVPWCGRAARRGAAPATPTTSRRSASAACRSSPPPSAASSVSSGWAR